MVERSASWQRLLQASWSRAKKISEQELPEDADAIAPSREPPALPAITAAPAEHGAADASVHPDVFGGGKACPPPAVAVSPRVTSEQGFDQDVEGEGMATRRSENGICEGAGAAPFIEINDDEEQQGGTEASGGVEQAATQEGEEAATGNALVSHDKTAMPSVKLGVGGVATAVQASGSGPSEAQSATPGVTGRKPKWGKTPSKPQWGKPQPGERREYAVDNGLLKADTLGLGFRVSKRLGDVDDHDPAFWGSLVSGADDGDGWLVVDSEHGRRFLPFMLDGAVVLVPHEAPAAPAETVPEHGSPPALAGAPPRAAVAEVASAPAGNDSPAATAKAGRQLTRTYSGQRYYSPKSPAVIQLQRAASFNGVGNLTADGQQVTPQPGLKRCFSSGDPEGEKPSAKIVKQDELCTGEYDLHTVAVSFSNVASSYVTTVLGRSQERDNKLFDWEGVRRCVRHLHCQLGLQVIGVVFENFWAPDRGLGSCGVPGDIKAMCTSIQEAPRLTGEKHRVADKEMTIKCAWRRNCRFVDNGGCDWLHEMRDEKCRSWLEKSQDLLQMRYVFEGPLGNFKLLDY